MIEKRTRNELHSVEARIPRNLLETTQHVRETTDKRPLVQSLPRGACAPQARILVDQVVTNTGDKILRDNRRLEKEMLEDDKDREDEVVIDVSLGTENTSKIKSLGKCQRGRKVFATGKDRSYKHRKKDAYTELFRKLPTHRNMTFLRTGATPAKPVISSKVRRTTEIRRPRGYEFDPTDVVKVLSTKLNKKGERLFLVLWKLSSGRKRTWLSDERVPKQLRADYIERVGLIH
jgi:hypothetical protein